MKILRILSLITLGFLGLTSIAGSIPMILDPSGSMLHMPLSLLEHSPFHSYLIPGIILLVTNGLVVIVVFLATAQRVEGYGNLVATQGVVITGWITVEVALLRLAIWPHYVYLGVGVVLIACGLVLRHDRRAVATRELVLR